MYIAAVSQHTSARDTCHRVDVQGIQVSEIDGNKGVRVGGRRKSLVAQTAKALPRYETRPSTARTVSSLVWRSSLVGLRSVSVACTGQSDVPDAVVCHMQIFAELIDDLHADLAMTVQKMKQVFAPDLGDLHRVEGLGCDCVTATSERSAQAEHLTGRSYPQGHAAAAFRADGKAHASLAEEEDSAGGLVFTKQYRSSWTSLERLDPIEFLESIRRQITENTIRALPAIETALRHIYFSPDVLIRAEGGINSDSNHPKW